MQTVHKFCRLISFHFTNNGSMEDMHTLDRKNIQNRKHPFQQYRAKADKKKYPEYAKPPYEFKIKKQNQNDCKIPAYLSLNYAGR